MTALSVALVIVCGLGLVALTFGTRVVRQYERGVTFRFGRVRPNLRGPGLALIVPFVDRLQKVNMQIITMPVPAQDGITRDNVTVRVDAVVYFRVMNAVRAAVDVQDYLSAIGQVAQTSLRSIIGKSDLDDLLCDREHLNQGMELMIDSPALDWGIHIERVEIKDVALPEGMKRSMSRQAEAERERRSPTASCRPPRSLRMPQKSWPSTPRRCSCGFFRRLWKLRPRRTQRWYSHSRSSSFDSWKGPPPQKPLSPDSLPRRTSTSRTDPVSLASPPAPHPHGMRPSGDPRTQSRERWASCRGNAANQALNSSTATESGPGRVAVFDPWRSTGDDEW
jgi:hypothetical protein